MATPDLCRVERCRPSKAISSTSPKSQSARTDLTGRRALLTGGRAKIGMYIALRLLRDGAHTTITTRFPRDAVRRFSSLPDAPEWIDRLKVVGIDLRDPAQVIGLARRAIRRSLPGATEEEVALRFVELHYGRELAMDLRRFLSAPRP